MYNYLGTCHPSSPKCELLKIVWPGRWKKFKYLPNRSEGVQCHPEIEVFDIFFIFHALQNVSVSQNDVFFS